MPTTVSAPVEKSFADFAEEWYADMGYAVPPRGSEEWDQMYEEWSECIAHF